MADLQTEFEFTLPRGYVDSGGKLHRVGKMRLATAADELFPLNDARVVANEAYLVVILLSRVITRLGNLQRVDSGVIEGLFSADLSYLQDFYRRINEDGTPELATTCPECAARFRVATSAPGGSLATPSTSSTRR
jgi:hypothetical protein